MLHTDTCKVTCRKSATSAARKNDGSFITIESIPSVIRYVCMHNFFINKKKKNSTYSLFE